MYSECYFQETKTRCLRLATKGRSMLSAFAFLLLQWIQIRHQVLLEEKCMFVTCLCLSIYPRSVNVIFLFQQPYVDRLSDWY